MSQNEKPFTPHFVPRTSEKNHLSVAQTSGRIGQGTHSSGVFGKALEQGSKEFRHRRQHGTRKIA